MKTALLFICILISQSVLAGQDLTGRACLSIAPPKSEDSSMPMFAELTGVVFLKNNSAHAMRVATGLPLALKSMNSGKGGQSALIECVPDSSFTPDGERVVLAESDLRVVILNPGEVAMLYGKLKISYPIKESDITVKYSVDRQTGERYGIWSGVVSMKGEPLMR